VLPQSTPMQHSAVLDPLLMNEQIRDGRLPEVWGEADGSNQYVYSDTLQSHQWSEVKNQDAQEWENKSEIYEDGDACFFEGLESSDISHRSILDKKASFWDNIESKLVQYQALSKSWKIARKRRQDGCRMLYTSYPSSHSRLHYAIGMDNVNLVKRLVHTENPNQYHLETGETPLHLACRLGRQAIVKILRRLQDIQVNLTTRVGTRISCKSGLTALDLAKKKGFWEIVNFLTNYKVKENRSPVTRTTKMKGSRPERVQLESMENVIKKMRSSLKKVKSRWSSLTYENGRLKKRLGELMDQDLDVMGIRLPRKKPIGTKQIAEIIPRLRELVQDLTKHQEHLWSKMEVETLCPVCKHRPRSVVISPCGHCMCKECTEGASTCPSCQVEIGSQIKIRT